MGGEDRLVEFLREQVKIEKGIVDSLNKALVDIENPAVKGSLKAVSLDSVKHSEMYTSAVSLLTEVPKALTQEHLDKQTELVKKHIELELRLIRKISEELPKVENEKVRLLLNAILSDEKRHHALLKELLEILVKGETITEEEWLDVMWKGVPFHGAPGG